MPYAPFLFKDIEKNFIKSFSEDIEKRVSNKRATMMSSDNVLTYQHGRNWETPANELGDKSGEMHNLSILSDFPLKVVVAGNPKAIFESAEGISNEMHEQMMGVLIQKLSVSTENSGNVINSAGRPIQETFLEMVESMHLSLDESGEISMPTLMLHPSQAATVVAELENAGPEFEAKMNDMKERKKVEAQEREKQRMARFEQRAL